MLNTESYFVGFASGVAVISLVWLWVEAGVVEQVMEWIRGKK